MYQLVNASLGFESALQNCKSQFGELTTSGLKDDEEGSQQLLSRHNLSGPVWFQSSNTQNPKARNANESKYDSVVCLTPAFEQRLN